MNINKIINDEFTFNRSSDPESVDDGYTLKSNTNINIQVLSSHIYGGFKDQSGKVSKTDFYTVNFWDENEGAMYCYPKEEGRVYTFKQAVMKAKELEQTHRLLKIALERSKA